MDVLVLSVFWYYQNIECIAILTLCSLDNYKKVLLQAVKTQMNAAECGISSGSAQFVKTKSILRERNAIFLKIITCSPSIFTMDQPDFTVLNFMEKSIGLNWVKMSLGNPSSSPNQYTKLGWFSRYPSNNICFHFFFK